MPIVLDTKPLLRPQFTSTEFKATKWDSAEVKAEFANKLCKFIAADFKETLFTKALYSRLSNTFGHIAHYDLRGFYGTFFLDLSAKVEFLEQTLQWPCWGDPEYTYSDVERAVQVRLRKSELLTAYRALRIAAIERAERETLHRLSAKYDNRTVSSSPIVIAVPAKAERPRAQTADQHSLF
jgi:hypothetical protein